MANPADRLELEQAINAFVGHLRANTVTDVDETALKVLANYASLDKPTFIKLSNNLYDGPQTNYDEANFSTNTYMDVYDSLYSRRAAAKLSAPSATGFSVPSVQTGAVRNSVDLAARFNSSTSGAPITDEDVKKLTDASNPSTGLKDKEGAFTGTGEVGKTGKGKNNNRNNKEKPGDSKNDKADKDKSDDKNPPPPPPAGNQAPKKEAKDAPKVGDSLLNKGAPPPGTVPKSRASRNAPADTSSQQKPLASKSDDDNSNLRANIYVQTLTKAELRIQAVIEFKKKHAAFFRDTYTGIAKSLASATSIANRAEMISDAIDKVIVSAASRNDGLKPGYQSDATRMTLLTYVEFLRSPMDPDLDDLYDRIVTMIR